MSRCRHCKTPIAGRRIYCSTICQDRYRRLDGVRCDDCGTTLLKAAALCGFCTPDYDDVAALAAIDLATA